MKNLVILFLCAFTFSHLAAQEQLRVMEAPKTMSEGVNNSLVIELWNVDAKTVEKEWRKYTRQFKGKTKKERKMKHWFTDDAKVRTISPNTVDIYAWFDENKKNKVTTATFWFNLGGAYVSSQLDPAQYGAAVKFLLDFKNSLDLVEAEDELGMQEKLLKELEKELEKLEKDNKDYYNKIEDAEKLIAEMKQKIQKNLKDQEAKRLEIDSQRKMVENAKGKVKTISN
jgi:hypothetical protein